MVQIQGIKLGLTMIALVVALLTVNTLSAASGVGIQLTAGGLTKDDVEQQSKSLQDPDATGVGTQDPGFFGIAVGISKTFQQLITLTTAVGPILKSWGVPVVIGYSVQIMVDATMGIGLLQILGRVKF